MKTMLANAPALFSPHRTWQPSPRIHARQCKNPPGEDSPKTLSDCNETSASKD